MTPVAMCYPCRESRTPGRCGRVIRLGIYIVAGQSGSVAIGVGALQRRQIENRRGPVGFAQDSAENHGVRLGACLGSRYDGAQPDVLDPQEMVEGAGTEAAVAFRA